MSFSCSWWTSFLSHNVLKKMGGHPLNTTERTIKFYIFKIMPSLSLHSLFTEINKWWGNKGKQTAPRKYNLGNEEKRKITFLFIKRSYDTFWLWPEFQVGIDLCSTIPEAMERNTNLTNLRVFPFLFRKMLSAPP